MRKRVGVKMLIVGASISLLLVFPLSMRPELSFRAFTTNISNAAEAPVATISRPQGLFDFVSLAKQLGPAVVNISTTQVNSRARESPSPFGQV